MLQHEDKTAWQSRPDLISENLGMLFSDLGVTPPAQEDSFEIAYTCGIIEIRIVRNQDERQEKLTFVCDGPDFSALQLFQPRNIPRRQRNELIRRLHTAQVSQHKIAGLLGLSTQMISHICRQDAP